MSSISPLSTCMIAENNALCRLGPRPAEHRNERYDEQFDSKTLFFDVFRNGKHIVFQGPPLLNLKAHALAIPYFKAALAKNAATLIERDRGGEIWVVDDSEQVSLSGSLGNFDIVVQADNAEEFKNKRVMMTLSKDNDLLWIVDWIKFHVALHGVEAVLIYDNNSSIYTADELQEKVRDAFPSLLIRVIAWPFKYGPQGGGSGGVNGVLAPWDSDYCQTGSFQHARFRFLSKAKSVLNCDIDELVVSKSAKSIFEATESSFFGVVDFVGTWVSNVTSKESREGPRRHSDYVLLEQEDQSKCPAKWCVVPSRCSIKNTWYVHAVQGRSNILTRSRNFNYRHFKPISNNWKYARWREQSEIDISSMQRDDRLEAAMKAAML